MIENQPIVVGILNSPEGIQYLDESAIRQELPPLTQEEIAQQQQPKQYVTMVGVGGLNEDSGAPTVIGGFTHSSAPDSEATQAL